MADRERHGAWRGIAYTIEGEILHKRENTMSFSAPLRFKSISEELNISSSSSNSNSNSSGSITMGMGNKGDRQRHWKSFLAELEAKFENNDHNNHEESKKRKSPSPEPVESQLAPTSANRLATIDEGTASIDFDTDWNNKRGLSNRLDNGNKRRGRGAMMNNSLYMQQLRRMRNFPANLRQPLHQAQSITPMALPQSLPLRDWITHYRKLHAIQSSSYNRNFNSDFGLHCQQNSLSGSSSNGMIDKSYLEKAASVALSLTKMIVERRRRIPSVDASMIWIDNVLVSDTKVGEARFVNTRSISSASTSQRSSSSDNERKSIRALGGIFYQMFTQGSSLPSSRPDDDIWQRRTRQHPGMSSSSVSDPSSFNMALKITQGLDANLSNNGNIDCRYRHKQPRRLSYYQPGNGNGNRDSNTYYTSLQSAGVPPSISRLITHMLENEEDLGGLLFRPNYDKRVTCLTDVMGDLQQMLDNPNSYLHDSLIMRLEPIIPNKMYGRDEELRICLDVAARTATRTTTTTKVAMTTTTARSMPISPKEEECPDSSSSSSSSFCQQAIVISGFSGCGKTFLVKEVQTRLEQKGKWQYLHCKFDQETKPQPLSTITRAFDNYLMHVVPLFDVGKKVELIRRIEELLDGNDVDTLSKIIPTLKKLMMKTTTANEDVIADACISNSSFSYEQKMNDEDISFLTRDAAASKFRLHRIFGLLVKALSPPKFPLLIYLDDLQWADTASLELINSLLASEHQHQPSTMTDEKLHGESSSEMLFIGAIRSNDVAASSSGPLEECIQKMKDCNTITLTEIHLKGLSSSGVNDIVSNALCYPRRLTRSLANLIHQKSAGSPLFVKELLNSLAAENLLTYSLSRHEWRWDEEVINLKSVSNGVVDILTSRLRRLPGGVLLGLQVMSCFGHDVSLEILVHVRDVFGTPDVVVGLDLAVKELLVTKSDNLGGDHSKVVYSFVHDMVQTTVYQGIDGQERVRLLKLIADTLIVRTSSSSSSFDQGRSDAILFIIVDLINRVSVRNTPDADDRLRYARMNLLAGEKAIQTPDFSSAIEYIESGISFLDDGHWENEYDLSLALFKNAASVARSLGRSNHMTKSLNKVFDNARCYEDKLDSMSVFIQSLVMAGKAEMALDYSLEVLRYLGEPFSNDIDKAAAEKELIETHKMVQQISSPASLEAIPAMKDPVKIKAMHFLYISTWSSHQHSSRLFSVICCRMVRLTLSHGLNFYSSAGMAGLARAYTAVLRNYTAGYKMGKLAISLNKSPKLVGAISLSVTNQVFVFKEPIQALLPAILENYQTSLKCGAISHACANTMCYVVRAYLSGSPLPALKKEMTIFFHQMSRHNEIRPYLCLIPIMNSITSLSGEPQHAFWDNTQGYEDNEKNLSKSFEKKDIALCEIIITIQMVEYFLFRRINLAEKTVRQYQDFLDLNAGTQIKFINVHRTFYSGLVAFHCFRQTKDQYWMDRGTKAIREMEAWANECKWNFENKMLLLKAEYHFSVGDFAKATEVYYLSITSAHNHRFKHEEALSYELAAYFHLEIGNRDLSIWFMKEAKECYQTWGAVKKAASLQRILVTV